MGLNFSFPLQQHYGLVFAILLLCLNFLTYRTVTVVSDSGAFEGYQGRCKHLAKLSVHTVPPEMSIIFSLQKYFGNELSSKRWAIYYGSPKVMMKKIVILPLGAKFLLYSFISMELWRRLLKASFIIAIIIIIIIIILSFL